jgi:orotate phosphoribosyltransferase-like protein
MDGFNFKMYGHSMEDYKTIIKALKMWLDIETAVGCPGHTTTANNIQKITDSEIYFSPKFKRQQKHKAKIKNFSEIENQRVDIKQKKEISSVLLCDDISTTGETLCVFETILRRKAGVKRVEKFVISHKKKDADKVFMVAIPELFDGIDMGDIDTGELFLG